MRPGQWGMGLVRAVDGPCFDRLPSSSKGMLVVRFAVRRGIFVLEEKICGVGGCGPHVLGTDLGIFRGECSLGFPCHVMLI